MAIKKVTGGDIVLLPISDIEPNPDNPNRQTDAEFQQLVREIEEDGFDEPIFVIPHPSKPGKYLLAQGEHRWAAMQSLGETEIPAIVKTDWTEQDARIKTVRRNILHGSLDRERFGALVKKLNEQDGLDMLDMPDTLGFTRESEFQKLIEEQQAQETKTTEQATEVSHEESKGVQVVDNMGFVVNEIFSQFGDEVDQGMVFFWYKNQFHMMVTEDDALHREITAVANYVKAAHIDLPEFFTSAIKNEFDRIAKETGDDPRDIPMQYKKGAEAGASESFDDIFG